MFLFKNQAGNDAGRLIPDLFLFFFNTYIYIYNIYIYVIKTSDKSGLYEVKTTGLQLSFNNFEKPQLGLQ